MSFTVTQGKSAIRWTSTSY